MRAELADGRILEFPDGTDPKVIQRTIKKMLGAQPDEQPQEQPNLLQRTGSLALESARNVPESAWNLVEGITQAAMNPVETLQALSEVAFGGVEQLIPGEQSHEEKFDQFVDIYKERYGGLDELHKTIGTDPMGVFADMSMFVSGAGTAASKAGQLTGSGRLTQAGSAMSKAGQAIDPINAAVTGFGKVAGGKPAESIYTSAAKMGTAKGASKRKSAVNKSLDEGLMPTEAGVNVLKEKKDILYGKLDEIIDKATEGGVTIKRDKLLSELRQAVYTATVGPNSSSVKKQIRNTAEQLRREHPKNISPRTAQDIKTGFQQAVKEAGYGKLTPGAKDAQKGIARAARLQLEKVSDDIGGINKELAEYKNLEKEIEKAAARIANRDPLGMTKMLLMSGGGAVGDVGGMAAGLGIGVLLDPRVQAKTAIMLRALKKKGITRDPKLFYAREAVRQGGIANTKTQTEEEL